MNVAALKNRFLAAFPDATATALARWADIQLAYSKKNRYYHNLNHLAEIFTVIDHYPVPVDNPAWLDLAVFYHDVVYNPLRKDNELRSAEKAISDLAALPAPARDTIFRHICATKTHQLDDPTDDALRLLLDADLMILSTERSVYELYTQQIRKEYRLVPDMLYRPGRKKVLAAFLARPTIYYTAHHKDHEPAARANLQWELNTL